MWVIYVKWVFGVKSFGEGTEGGMEESERR